MRAGRTDYLHCNGDLRVERAERRRPCQEEADVLAMLLQEPVL